MTDEGKRLIILDKTVMECLCETVTFEQNLERKERARQAKVWAKSFPNCQDSECTTVISKALKWEDLARRPVRLVQSG